MSKEFEKENNIKSGIPFCQDHLIYFGWQQTLNFDDSGPVLTFQLAFWHFENLFWELQLSLLVKIDREIDW